MAGRLRSGMSVRNGAGRLYFFSPGAGPGAGGSCAFHDTFFEFGEPKHGQGKGFLGYLHHPMNQRPGDREGMMAGFRHRQSIGQREAGGDAHRGFGCQSRSEAGGAGWFDANDLQIRL